MSKLVSNKECGNKFGYHFKVKYEFKLDKRTFTGSEVRVGMFRYYSKTIAMKFVEKYPVDSKVLVYFPVGEKPFKSDGEWVSPCTYLQPGFNIECLYSITILTIFFGLILTDILCLIKFLTN